MTTASHFDDDGDNDGERASVTLEAVSKRYGTQSVLENADLQVRRGEQLAVIGRSGSGKSTLLRLIGSLEPPDTGEIRVAGHDLGGLSETERASVRRSTIGFVFQFFNLIPTLTVGENVELPLALNGAGKAEAQRSSAALLGELGLGGFGQRFPDELSGGEQQRVAIARAVVHAPQIVLADEPTGNLDADTADRVLALLGGLCRRRGTTLVLATHSREAAALADRVVVIEHGRIETAPA
jgi:putative ABC transport system ATP-binding protein